MKDSYRKRASDPTWPRAMRGQAARLHLKRWTGVYVGGVLRHANERNPEIRFCVQEIVEVLDRPFAQCREVGAARPSLRQLVLRVYASSARKA